MRVQLPIVSLNSPKDPCDAAFSGHRPAPRRHEIPPYLKRQALADTLNDLPSVGQKFWAAYDALRAGVVDKGRWGLAKVPGKIRSVVLTAFERGRAELRLEGLPEKFNNQPVTATAAKKASAGLKALLASGQQTPPTESLVLALQRIPKRKRMTVDDRKHPYQQDLSLYVSSASEGRRRVAISTVGPRGMGMDTDCLVGDTVRNEALTVRALGQLLRTMGLNLDRSGVTVLPLPKSATKPTSRVKPQPPKKRTSK